mgnify:CR=1 FL=1
MNHEPFLEYKMEPLEVIKETSLCDRSGLFS